MTKKTAAATTASSTLALTDDAVRAWLEARPTFRWDPNEPHASALAKMIIREITNSKRCKAEDVARIVKLVDGILGEEPEEAEEVEDTSEPTLEAGDEVAPASEEAGDEAKVSRSCVNPKYREEYRARGDSRGCGDWLFLMFKVLTLDKTGKLDIDAFLAIADHNDVGAKARSYITGEKRGTNGWQGRARMSTRQVMEPFIVRDNQLVVDASLFEAHKAQIEALLADPKTQAEVAGMSVNAEDDMAFLIPPSHWTSLVLSRRSNLKKGSK
jgi:hypothetical protein